MRYYAIAAMILLGTQAFAQDDARARAAMAIGGYIPPPTPVDPIPRPIASVPPCHCGCMETGKCMCQNCAKRTADPTDASFVKTPEVKMPLIKWRSDYDAAVEEAKARDLPLLVYVQSPDCVYCRKLERSFNYAATAVVVNAKMVPVKIDGSVEKEFARVTEITSFPTLTVYDSDTMQQIWRGVGYRDQFVLKRAMDMALVPRIAHAIAAPVVRVVAPAFRYMAQPGCRSCGR